MLIGPGRFFDDALRFQFSRRQDFAELPQALGGFADDLAHDFFPDFHDLAVGLRAHGGAAVLTGQQGHLAETVARLEGGHGNHVAVLGHRNLGASVQQDEHGITRRAFFNDAFIAAELHEMRLLDEILNLRVGQALENGLGAQDGPGLLVAGVEGGPA